MSESPIQRLNYFNGQRLEASDFKLEQDYHIRVRRWINRSLYTTGIARGLEVRAEPGAPVVVVSPGLALDPDGREIILLDEQRVTVVGDARHHSGTAMDAEFDGLYLTIRYDEARIADQSGSCAAANGTPASMQSKPATGGPSRVLAAPLFAWRSFLPSPSSGEILLAQVELNDACSAVQTINPGDRRYIGAASAATVRQYALEGEREVAFIPKEAFPAPGTGAPTPTDVSVVGRFYFHVRGRQPNSVSLYLRADQLSALHYTELGFHNHGLSVTTAVPTSTPVYADDPLNPHKYKHTHGLDAVGTASDGAHTDHTLEVFFAGDHSGGNNPSGGKMIQLIPAGGQSAGDILPALSDLAHGSFTAQIKGGAHSHGFNAGTETAETLIKDDHTHTFTPQVGLGGAGVSADGRAGARLTYVTGLQIWIGHDDVPATNHTTDILQQIADADPTSWGGKTRMGEGGAGGDVLKESGTGPIRLDFLPGVAFVEGEYFVEFRVDPLPDQNGNLTVPNGGRILYNLYVE